MTSPTRPQTVYLFGTCIVDLFFPTAGISAIKLLEREGIRVCYPQEQSCCGQPAYSSGYLAEARTVAAAQIAVFPGDEPIVVLSGSCAGMMKHHYPSLFAGLPQQAEAQAFANRIYEFTEFLSKVLHIELKDLGEPVDIASHTSCAARPEMTPCQKLSFFPKRRMRSGRTPAFFQSSSASVSAGRPSAPSKTVTHHEPEACGFGRTFSVRHPHISAAMVEDKTSALKACGAQQVVSADCACLLNINGALEKQGASLRGQHIADFLWQRTQHVEAKQ